MTTPALAFSSSFLFSADDVTEQPIPSGSYTPTLRFYPSPPYTNFRINPPYLYGEVPVVHELVTECIWKSKLYLPSYRTEGISRQAFILWCKPHFEEESLHSFQRPEGDTLVGLQSMLEGSKLSLFSRCIFLQKISLNQENTIAMYFGDGSKVFLSYYSLYLFLFLLLPSYS